VLRASHAKPWAECASDAERLDVYNGFLLSANLDALFDRFLISFDPAGGLLLSAAIGEQEIHRLGLNKPLGLRWLAAGHAPYLDHHRATFGKMAARVC
jgi:putative restriction endonuclease